MKKELASTQTKFKDRPPSEQLVEIKTRLSADGVEFFVNSVLEPTVHISSDGYQKDWPADSQRFHDFLNMAYYELADGEFLKPTLRDMLLSLLREECRSGVRRMSEIESPRSENNPIVQGVLYLMNKDSVLDLLTALLARRLSELQSKGRIAQRPTIPTFTNIFSRQLTRLVPVFKGLGIDVAVRHEVDGSHCKIERLPAFQGEPAEEDLVHDNPDDSPIQSSAEPSALSSTVGTPLSVADGSYGRIRVDAAREQLAGNQGGAE